MKCPINLIFKETESFGFELVSILLIKYCSGSKIIRLPLKKEHNLHGQDLKTYSSENYEWSQWDCDFFYAKGFYNFFRTYWFDFFTMFFLLCFFCLFTGKYKLGLLLSYFSIGVLFPIEGIGWNCLEIMGQDLCFIYLVQPPSQWWGWSAYFKSIIEIPL